MVASGHFQDSIEPPSAFDVVLLILWSVHENQIMSVAYAPDGTRLLTASFDKTARIWDAKTGDSLVVLSGHGGTVNTAVYSPDGSRVATASADKTVRIWDAKSGAQLALLGGHGDKVESVAYSPDGKRLVSASADMTVRIWDADKGTQIAEMSGPREAYNSAAYSPDAANIVTTSRDKARLWDAQTGAPLEILSVPGDSLSWAEYSPDGGHILTSHYGKVARLWEAAAETQSLSVAELVQLGLPHGQCSGVDSAGSLCDQTAGSCYDPDRISPGVPQERIDPEQAKSACSDATQASNQARTAYQLGRALLAKNDLAGARQQFDFAASKGYRAANIDIANMLTAEADHPVDAGLALTLYEKAWNDGVPIAAYELGHLYEAGSPSGTPPDVTKAWAWYQKGADAREPSALGRFGERADLTAAAETDAVKRRTLMLEAFRFYAAAAERAKQADWPDEAWSKWRYRRATLARILARHGQMNEVAQIYQSLLKK